MKPYLLIVLPLAAALSAYSQSMQGTLTGIVSDPSQAVVAAAKVTATNRFTGVQTTTQTTGEGVYTLSLRPGLYDLTVEAAGFKTLVRQGIEVNVNQTSRVDLQLEVGQLAEKITIEAAAPLIQAETSELGLVIRSQMVVDLPLSTPGNRRWADAFTLLTPGMAATADPGPFGLGDVSANGAQRRTRDVHYDGITAGEIHSPGRIWASAPPPDAIQEFKMITGNYSAEFGGVTGGIVSLTTRSGSNELHGSFYEFLRNDKLHARSFFAQSRPKDRQSEAGVTLGGPVVIPGLYDGRNRTFFFGYYNLMRWRTESAVRIVTVPPPELLRGDFTTLRDPQGNMKLIFDPLTSRRNAAGDIERSPFPGNVIPSNRISKVSQNVAALIPKPNIRGVGTTLNYLGRDATISNDDRWMIKLDHLLTDRQRLSTSYTWANFVRDGWGPFPKDQQYLSGFTTRDEYAHVIRLSHEFTISPTVVNQFSFGFNRDAPFTGSTSRGGGWGKKLGITGIADPDGMFPHILFGSDVEDGQRLSGEANAYQAENSFVYTDIVSVIRGKHSMRLGGDFRKYQLNVRTRHRSHGTFRFDSGFTSNPASPNRANTGSGVATFLLGAVQSATCLFPTVTIGDRFTYASAFFQDNYKITRRLTLNLGLRWEVARPMREVANRMSVFDPTLPNPGVNNLPGALAFLGFGPGKLNKDAIPVTDWNNLQPRFGFAYGFRTNTVIRGGYGVFTGMAGSAIEGAIGSRLQQGYNAQPTFSVTDPSGINPAFYWDAGFPQDFEKPPILVPTFLNRPLQALDNWIRPEDGIMPYVQQWQLGVQRQFGNHFSLETTYVGTKGTRLPSQKLRPQQLHPSYMRLGTLLTQDINSPAARAAGYLPPYPGFVGTVAQSLRQFPHYLDITAPDEMLGFSNYQSFQLLVQKRYSYGLNLTLAYTVSKLLGDAELNAAEGKPGIMDTYNPQLDKALASYDAPHNLAIGYSYEMPFGRGRRFDVSSPALRKLAEGWQITGTWRYFSGRPASISGAETTGIFSGNRPTYVYPFQPIRTDVKPGDFDPARHVYFNRSAFSLGERFRFGDLPPRLPSTRGFAYFSENIGILKKTQIKESLTLEIRGEAYNFTNRVVFSDPNTALTSVSFGRVSGQSNNPRQMQIGMRLSF